MNLWKYQTVFKVNITSYELPHYFFSHEVCLPKILLITWSVMREGFTSFHGIITEFSRDQGFTTFPQFLEPGVHSSCTNWLHRFIAKVENTWPGAKPQWHWMVQHYNMRLHMCTYSYKFIHMCTYKFGYTCHILYMYTHVSSYVHVWAASGVLTMLLCFRYPAILGSRSTKTSRKECCYNAISTIRVQDPLHPPESPKEVLYSHIQWRKFGCGKTNDFGIYSFPLAFFQPAEHPCRLAVLISNCRSLCPSLNCTQRQTLKNISQISILPHILWLPDVDIIFNGWVFGMMGSPFRTWPPYS